MAKPKQRILIVDDTPPNRALLEAMLSDYDTVTAENGLIALDLLAAEGASIDLILLDVMMPEIDGYETARRIKADPKTHGIPIIMVTALHDRTSMMASLEAGAEEFLSKPIERVELLARVRNMLRLRAYSQEIAHHAQKLEAQVAERTADLTAEIATRIEAERENARLHRQDTLTGLPNHVAFCEQVQTLFDQCRAEQPPSGPILLFLIAFNEVKALTHTQGRQARDILICQIASRLSCSSLGQHFLAHLEPGIFSIVMGPLNAEQMASIDASLQHCVHDALKLPFEVGGTSIKLSYTIGISQSNAPHSSPLALIAEADNALYWSQQPNQRPIQWATPEVLAQAADCYKNSFEISRRIETLSPREREVSDLIVAGHASKMIGYLLGTSARTVDAQRVRIMAKLHADTLADLVRIMMSALSAKA